MNNNASGENSAVHNHKQLHCSSRGGENDRKQYLSHSQDQLSYIERWWLVRCAPFHAQKGLFFGLQ